MEIGHEYLDGLVALDSKPLFVVTSQTYDILRTTLLRCVGAQAPTITPPTSGYSLEDP